MTCIYTENITRLTRHNAHSTTHAPWHWYSTTHTHTHTQSVHRTQHNTNTHTQSTAYRTHMSRCTLRNRDMFCDVRACFMIPWCTLWCQDVLCDIMCLCSLTSWCVLWCQGMFFDSLVYSVFSGCGLSHHDAIVSLSPGAYLHTVGTLQFMCLS